MMGVIAAFGVDKRSNIAAGIMIIVAQATSIWNVGIQTAAAQNLLTVGFMEKMLGQRVAWSDWLIERELCLQLREDERSQRLLQIPGIGPITAC